PTSLTAKVLPAADVSSVVHSGSYHLDVQQPDRASTWYPVDAANLQIVNYRAPADGSLLLGANMDLWTTRPGYNQDVAIFSSVDCSNPANLVTCKESGGFAGTFSPNAAYGEGSVPVSKGQVYNFSLCWKATLPAS